MFVGKKKYEEALRKIIELEQHIKVNNEHLKSKDDKLDNLTKEYDSLVKIHNETKVELEELVTSKISHKNSVLFSLNTELTSIESELKNKKGQLSQIEYRHKKNRKG